MSPVQIQLPLPGYRVSLRYLGASAIVGEEKLAVLAKLCTFWPDGQAVKTSPFHGGNPGSSPGGVTTFFLQFNRFA